MHVLCIIKAEQKQHQIHILSLINALGKRACLILLISAESFLNNSSSRNWSSKNSRSALPASSSSCQLDSAATIKRSLMGANVARLGRSAHLVSSSKTPLYDRPCFEASLPPSSSSPLMRLIFRGLAAQEENWRLAWRGACSTGRLVRCGRLCARAVQAQCKSSANISSASMCAKST